MKAILKTQVCDILLTFFLLITTIRINAREISQWGILNELAIKQQPIDFVDENIDWMRDAALYGTTPCPFLRWTCLEF